MIWTRPKRFEPDNTKTIWIRPKQFGLPKTIWTVQNHFVPIKGQGIRHCFSSTETPSTFTILVCLSSLFLFTTIAYFICFEIFSFWLLLITTQKFLCIKSWNFYQLWFFAMFLLGIELLNFGQFFAAHRATALKQLI